LRTNENLPAREKYVSNVGTIENRAVWIAKLYTRNAVHLESQQWENDTSVVKNSYF